MDDFARSWRRTTSSRSAITRCIGCRRNPGPMTRSASSTTAGSRSTRRDSPNPTARSSSCSTIFTARLASQTCGDDAKPRHVTDEATELRAILCETVADHLFNVVLDAELQPTAPQPLPSRGDGERSGSWCTDDRTRCAWAADSSPAMTAYHDPEWGVPTHDDRKPLRVPDPRGCASRPVVEDDPRQARGYRKTSADFDPTKVAKFHTGEAREDLARPEHRAKSRQGRVGGRRTRRRSCRSSEITARSTRSCGLLSTASRSSTTWRDLKANSAAIGRELTLSRPS